MAYTKEPEASTRSTFPIRAVGSQTFTHNTQNWAAERGQRYINCFPQPKYMVGEDPSYKLLKTPPLETATAPITITPATTGVIDCFDNDTLLFCKDKYIYQIESGGDITLRATHGVADTVFRSIQKVIDYSGNDVIVCGVLENSGGFYAYEWNDTTSTMTTSASPIVSLADGATWKSLFIDGYHVIGNLTTGQIFTSTLETNYATFDTANDYIVPEIEADALVDIHKHKNTICAMGRKSIEFFYNNANELGSPFSRHEDLTLKLGTLDQTKTIADGDDIYFLGSAPNSGLGVWRIRDFKAERISDLYIDYLLNNMEDVGSPATIDSIVLGMIDIYGTVQFAMAMQDNDLTWRVFVFNEKAKIWWEWVYSDEVEYNTGYQLLWYMGGRQIYVNGTYFGGLYWEDGYAAASYVAEASTRLSTDMSMTKIVLNADTIEYTFFTKQQSLSETIAEFYTNLFDFGTDNRKKIEYVDAVGDYGNNTVELAYTKKRTYDDWTTYQLRTPSSIGEEYPIRWTNLCSTRYIAFRVRFKGTDNFAHDHLMVGYNRHLT